MDGTLESYQVILDVFRAWQGHDDLQRVMDHVPDLDVFIAGGVVRDVILGRRVKPKDFDFFLAGPSVGQAVAMLGESGGMSAGPFGSPRWFPKGESGVYCDLIPITRFRNGLWDCADITDVLNQFDFTGNAVAFDLREGRFFDPQNGRRDIGLKVMRALRFDYPDEPIIPGHPLSRPVVLWFRILHYARVLGWTIEPITRSWLADRRDYIAKRGTFASVFFEPHPDAFGPVG